MFAEHPNMLDGTQCTNALQFFFRIPLALLGRAHIKLPLRLRQSSTITVLEKPSRSINVTTCLAIEDEEDMFFRHLVGSVGRSPTKLEQLKGGVWRGREEGVERKPGTSHNLPRRAIGTGKWASNHPTFRSVLVAEFVSAAGTDTC